MKMGMEIRKIAYQGMSRYKILGTRYLAAYINSDIPLEMAAIFFSSKGLYLK